MTISTYSNLQAQVASFLNREDLTATVPTFIALAEANINRLLRHWRMEVRTTTPLDAQFSALPSGWRETIRLSIDGEALELVSQSRMLDLAEIYEASPGQPRFYAHTNGTLEVMPVPDKLYTGEMVYVQDVPALSDDEPTNWLLLDAPDVYLYGALVHSAPFLQEDARTAVWASFFQSSIDALNAESRKAKHSGTGLRMRKGKAQ